MADLSAVVISEIRTIYGSRAEGIVEDVRLAFQRSPDALKYLAWKARIASDPVSSGENLERIEGRREMFWAIMAIVESDPLRVAQFLTGGSDLE